MTEHNPHTWRQIGHDHDEDWIENTDTILGFTSGQILQLGRAEAIKALTRAQEKQYPHLPAEAIKKKVEVAIDHFLPPAPPGSLPAQTGLRAKLRNILKR